MDFENLNLKKELLNQLLKVGYTQATDIQINLIPKINEGLDVIGQAPTGTGKTLAFIIPILQNVKNEKKIQSLIIAPTRELVNQINDEIKKINYNPQTIFSYSIYGGIEINKQINFIKKYSPTIIVSTPGRLLDLLKRGIISVESINNITLDEVDVMLQMGFEKDLQRIFDFIKNKTQVIFISATIPTEIKKISSKYQNNPFFFKVESVEENQPQIKQYYTVVRNSQKLSALKAILEKNQFFLAIVFCNMKYLTKEIAAFLNENNFKAEAFQGNLKQNKREQLIKSFRKGDVNVLVATDIVARGIDIKNVDIVVNYDLPDDLNNYVHRIGRSGRNKTVGTSFIMVSMNQKWALKELERKTENKIEEYQISDLVEINSDQYKDKSKGEGSGQGHGRYQDKENRYFIGLGTFDGFNPTTFKDFLCQQFNVQNSDIIDIYMKDKFSFVQFNAKLVQIPEIKFNNRTVRIDVSDSSSSSSPRNNNNHQSGSSFKPRFQNKKPFNNRFQKKRY